MKAAALGSPEIVADLLLSGAQKIPNPDSNRSPTRFEPKRALEIAEVRRDSESHRVCCKLLSSNVSRSLIKAFKAV